MEDLTGKQLGPYQIVSPLGEGGMAAVFKAYHPIMDRYVALKVLPRHFSKNPEFIHRFSQEARLIAKLEHPHILPVHDFGESDGYTYLAMRLVEGGSLADLLKRRDTLNLAQIGRIISHVGGALNYAHDKGVIHRDFKPGNVLIDKFENCLLTDFGIAKLVEATSHLTHTGGILGTPAYISPEQGSGKPIDKRSDIYALGVVLYQMVVGDLPYKADTPMAVIFKHIHDPLPLPRQRVPDLPESIERVILKALAKNPDDRYSTAADLVSALRNAIEQPTAEVKEVHEPILEPDPGRVVKEMTADETELPFRRVAEPRPAVEVPVRKFILLGLGLLVVSGLIVWGMIWKKQNGTNLQTQSISSVTDPNKLILQSESVSSVTTPKKPISRPEIHSGVNVPDQKEVERDGNYIKYASGMVYDKNTGLEWYAGPDKDTDFNEAKAWVENLTVAGGGWRMPTRKELKTLYQKGVGTRYMTPLLKTTGWYVWSGETSGYSSAWDFYFASGRHEFWGSRVTSNSSRRGFAVRSQIP